MGEGDDVPRWGFCGCSAKEVRSVIAGQEAAICNECVETCAEVVQMGLNQREAELPPADATWIVEAIAYYPGSPTTECRLEIEIARPTPPEHRTIECQGVSQLTLGPKWTNMPYSLVVSIEDRGWDRLRYSVSMESRGSCGFSADG